MGYKGTIQSIQATARKIERAELKRQREIERRRKEAAKLAALEQATLEVEEFENYLEVITSVHMDCGYVWDWSETLRSVPPDEPAKVSKRQDKAKQKIDSFKPSFFVKMFKQEEKKRASLNEKLEIAIEKDNEEYQDLVEDYKDAYSEWETITNLASRIVAGDIEAYRAAIDEAKPYEEIYKYGSAFNTNVISKDAVEVLFQVNDERVIPSEMKSLLKSGKLSVKNMPKSRYYELYQDYVCGSTIRVARELFALLPINRVLVTATCNMLNTATGHKEQQNILSVLMPREIFNKLNFQQIDPSNSLVNFEHKMKFYKTKGFAPIDAIKVSE